MGVLSTIQQDNPPFKYIAGYPKSTSNKDNRRRRQLNSPFCWKSPLNDSLHQREKAEKLTVVIRVPAYEAEVGNSSTQHLQILHSSLKISCAHRPPPYIPTNIVESCLRQISQSCMKFSHQEKPVEDSVIHTD
ncbi:hypothetical protein CDAR_391411 [Caerostris darwini]|uniref:Uncharacterized protein n=1 Tax=Caerostris darwini TaxID=1538125 RepID=A0AAV4W821_9ARAC|nr:hypothetical protein CDAR_391411 [Caerostris darwini]